MKRQVVFTSSLAALFLCLIGCSARTYTVQPGIDVGAITSRPTRTDKAIPAIRPAGRAVAIASRPTRTDKAAPAVRPARRAVAIASKPKRTDKATPAVRPARRADAIASRPKRTDKAAPAAQSTTGNVTGVISISRTRVKTTGFKSYKDVVVYLVPEQNKAFPAPKKTVQMDQKKLVFFPHVLAVQKGTTVEFLNSDTVNHNVFCVDDCCGGDLDLGQWGKGKRRSYKFERVGAATLLCKLHPEMAAYVIVVDTPYFTMAEIDAETQQAKYKIVDVPPGKYALRTWHKKLGEFKQQVTVEQGKAKSVDIELKKKERRRRRKRR